MNDYKEANYPDLNFLTVNYREWGGMYNKKAGIATTKRFLFAVVLPVAGDRANLRCAATFSVADAWRARDEEVE